LATLLQSTVKKKEGNPKKIFGNFKGVYGMTTPRARKSLVTPLQGKAGELGDSKRKKKVRDNCSGIEDSVSYKKMGGGKNSKKKTKPNLKLTLMKINAAKGGIGRGCGNLRIARRLTGLCQER